MKPRKNNLEALQRRQLFAGAAGVAAALALPRAAVAQPVESRGTPAQTLGPFYPRSASERPRETDADLLQNSGNAMLAKGVPLYLTGTVRDGSGAALASAAIEIWQCDANAVYHHPAGGAESERDPHFQGYGVARTDAAGRFHFRTIRPVAYPGRTPHIHVRVQAQDGRVLATQLYLPDHPGNRRDFLYSRLSAAEQAALTLQLGPPAAGVHPLAQATQQTARADLVLA